MNKLPKWKTFSSVLNGAMITPVVVAFSRLETKAISTMEQSLHMVYDPKQHIADLQLEVRRLRHDEANYKFANSLMADANDKLKKENTKLKAELKTISESYESYYHSKEQEDAA